MNINLLMQRKMYVMVALGNFEIVSDIMQSVSEKFHPFG